MSIEKADNGDSKSTRKSFFSRKSAASSKDHAAKVFQSHAPKTDADGNLQTLQKPKIAKSTKKQRDRALIIWEDYMNEHHPNVDADQVWVDLCRGDATAMQYCKAFLQLYVENSESVRIVLDEREEVVERKIKSSRSLNTFWKSLIAAADAEVLLPLRNNPDNYRLTLKRPTDRSGALDDGPVSQISHWIYHEGAEVMKLSTKPDYQKVEFTITDIGLILKTLWLCANLIPFVLPIQRVIFHALVLLFSYGFRQGMIMNMKYDDVIVAVIRDGDRRRLVTTFTIWRNKLRANALEPTKGEKFQFTTTLLPYPLFCLTHLIVVIGIYFNGFEAGYKSVEEVLHKANLEEVDYVHLKWRKNMADKKIFNMSYTSFWRTLRRVLLVAGFSTLARIYAFRLGALADDNDTLSQATRNFVASHTTEVFETKYQTERVREDLSQKRFKAYAGGKSNDPLFEVMRDLSKQNDPRAPIEATAEQKRSIEGRRDITARREALEQAKRGKDEKEIAKAKSALDQRRRALYDLLVMDARTKYFVEANKLRAAGESTDRLRKGSMKSNKRSASEELVFDLEAEDRSEKAMVWLCRYVRKEWSLLSRVLPTPTISTPTTTSITTKAKPKTATLTTLTKWTCLLCVDKSYSTRSSLTRHTKKQHINEGTFNHPFQCPECQRESRPPHMISSAREWNNHVEPEHGIMYTPVFQLLHCDESGFSLGTKAPAPPRKTASAKRKRDDEDTSKKSSFTGVLVLDMSGKKKARVDNQESLPRLANSGSICFSQTPIMGVDRCSLDKVDLVGGSQSSSGYATSASSVSDDGSDIFSLAPSEDTNTTLESPQSSDPDTTMILDSGLLAKIGDGIVGGFEGCGDVDEMFEWDLMEQAKASGLLEDCYSVQGDDGEQMYVCDEENDWNGFDD